MDNNLLKAEDLADLVGEIKFSTADLEEHMSNEIKASQRRVEEYIKKNLDNE